ncbi:MAG: hypothetical protein RR851_10275 [Clostridium sp.]
MKNPKKLLRRHKEFLAEQGFKSNDFLIEREEAWSYVFYNTHTKQLIDMRR